MQKHMQGHEMQGQGVLANRMVKIIHNSIILISYTRNIKFGYSQFHLTKVFVHDLLILGFINIELFYETQTQFLYTINLVLSNTQYMNPIDGQWSEWSSYSLCSVTCGDGTKTRTRTCTNPSPRNGGNNCTGGAEQTETCSTGTECVVDGGYSEWTTWTDCQGECESSGLIYRQRSCNNPKPSGGGKQCIGKKFDYIPCVKTCTSTLRMFTVIFLCKFKIAEIHKWTCYK
ncbi:hypothetical protein KUTeg_001374 [Tegillarca granosa]|uniref:HMCN n=1 Tax=Tegillarca granosa TaxID=220873 RepID=A0ABQ9FSW9_TEGGR|nr:hypothetical protein KUTeg_001374 [Tegillarca granosa]